MDRKRFDNTLSLESSVARYVIGAEIVALAVALILFLVGGKSTRGVLLLVSSFALLGFGLAALFLWMRYRRHPLVKEKQPLLREYEQVRDEIERNETQRNAAVQRHTTIDAEREQELEQRRETNRKRLAGFQKRRTAIDQNQRRELGEALLRLQRQHLAEGLRATQIKDAKIPGVGPKLKQRLAARRILTAADVESGRIAQVDGFGEAKARAVLAWRASVESSLKATQPTRLPQETKAKIQHKYEQERAQVASDEEVEEAAIEEDLAEVARRAEARHEEARNLEAKANVRLLELDPQRTTLTARLAPYAEIAPRCFLLECIGIHGGKARGWQWLAVILLPLVLVVSLLCQAGSTVGTLTSMVIGSIPTRTPTATATVTPIATRTPTATSTATPTPVPSATRTLPPTPMPTRTSTRQPTQTPTATAVPTSTSTPTAPPVPTATPAPKPTPVRLQAQVVGVIDGQSIDVVIGGQQQRVRYIGIDVPPVGESLGAEAKAENQTLTEGKIVYIETDEIETDAEGRMLAYVFLQNGTFVNEEMVRRGYATVKENPGNKRYYQRLVKAQNEARTAGTGLWGPKPTTRALATLAPAPPRTNCSPCYPSVCIPPPPPDLDCGDIPYRNFTVLDCDPHRFDGDGDGIGCER